MFYHSVKSTLLQPLEAADRVARASASERKGEYGGAREASKEETVNRGKSATSAAAAGEIKREEAREQAAHAVATAPNLL